MGPPGLNGTQGLPGTSPTRGDLTLCSYQEKKGAEVSAGVYSSTDVSVNEANVGLNERSLTQPLYPGREPVFDLFYDKWIFLTIRLDVSEHSAITVVL